MAKNKEPGFEELLAQTEEIVDNLESGGQGLEDSLKLYEKGVENLRHCAKMIGEAEEKVKVLLEKSKGAFELADFDEPESDDDDE